MSILTSDIILHVIIRIFVKNNKTFLEKQEPTIIEPLIIMQIEVRACGVRFGWLRVGINIGCFHWLLQCKELDC